jgi:protein-S-isoprenylcysteine O-methyltransferase Ste14
MYLKVLIMLSYLFLFSELLLSFIKRSKRKSVKIRGDKGSLTIIWIIITICLCAGFNLGKYNAWVVYNYVIYAAGIMLFFLGLIIRWTSILQLKKAFTVDVAINQEHKLKTDGLYNIIRHPSYMGGILILTGLSLGMNSLLSFLVIVPPVYFAFLYRIKVEESVLKKEFGSEYEEYMKKVKRIIPFIY